MKDMLRIRRLNMDTSWQLQWNGTILILDPWLIGSEIDGFSWFNEQWHTTPPVAVDKLGDYDSLIISQSYSDHCHEPTLELLQGKPIFATPKAHHRLRKSKIPAVNTLADFESGTWSQVGNLQVAYLDPGRKLDPVYYGIVVHHQNEIFLYAPHGFTPSEEQVRLLKPFEMSLLITSFSLFRLPGFMGGDVNPGVQRARELVRLLSPRKVFHTHDEQKDARGLVRKIARVEYPDYDQLQEEFPNTFVYMGEDYRYFTIAGTATSDQ